MKEIEIEELASINAEIYEAAVQVGCTHVRLTGRIWPGGQITGPSDRAARFVEFSWHKAAVINGQAIFEDADPRAYAALLSSYGLEEEPIPLPEQAAVVLTSVVEDSERRASSAPAELRVMVKTGTKEALEVQARTLGIAVGELLDRLFRAD